MRNIYLKKYLFFMKLDNFLINCSKGETYLKQRCPNEDLKWNSLVVRFGEWLNNQLLRYFFIILLSKSSMSLWINSDSLLKFSVNFNILSSFSLLSCFSIWLTISRCPADMRFLLELHFFLSYLKIVILSR